MLGIPYTYMYNYKLCFKPNFIMNFQLELFNPLGASPIRCFSCGERMFEKVEIVKEVALCGLCFDSYIRSLEVMYRIVVV